MVKSLKIGKIAKAVFTRYWEVPGQTESNSYNSIVVRLSKFMLQVLILLT